MKKIFTLFAAVVCGLAVNAKTIYLNTGGSSLWGKDNPDFWVHAWGGQEEYQDLKMSQVNGDVYSVDINDEYNNIIFLREATGSTSVIWEGDDLWNKTGNLDIPSNKNLFTMTSWDNGEWSVYGDEPGPGPQPQPQGAYDYYLRGFFNGADTATPTPEEMFENGILANFTFSGDNDNHKGYFYVMVCDAGQVVGRDYMLEEYVDGGTHVTLSDKESTGHAQKWGIPEGTVTFYLYDNEDGTLELSTVELPDKKLVGGGSGSTPGQEAVENTVVKTNARKAMIDGRLVIIRGEQMFDATGRAL